MQITKEQFLTATVKQVSQVYSGRSECCRCGCQGTYTATSAMIKPFVSINDSLVAKRLNRAQRLVTQGAPYESGDTWVDITTGDNRTLTFYFDDVHESSSLI
jgi:hypothetical protein